MMYHGIVDTTETKYVGGNVFARDAVEESPYSYSFEDVNLI